MKAGIIGLPNVGKSTLYNALTRGGAEASNYPFCTIEPNFGVSAVPDERLEVLRAHIEHVECLPASLHLVDIAGLVKGASRGEGLGNKFLAHIREVDALLHIVRCFDNDDIVHVDGAPDPARDIETIETELMLADLQLVETALPKAHKAVKGGTAEDTLRAHLLERCQAALAEGRPVRGLEFEEEAARMLKGLGLLTAKRMLFIANIDEQALADPEIPYVRRIEDYVAGHGGGVIPVCAEIEAELLELEEKDRLEMRLSMGLKESALARVARATYALLGQISFFTTDSKKIRAWTLRSGATAPQAAGVIHTDFERGFIRAEVYQVEDLREHHSEANIRHAGKMRIEGKHYVVKDGDVCHFHFNP